MPVKEAAQRPSAVTHARPARQERSRKTVERLLDAAEASLEEKGLEGATVPVIAARCGLSVGVVYRRFPDKDALIRAVYERFFARSREKNRAALEPERWTNVPTAGILRSLIGGMVAGYRLRGGLLRALLLYAETHSDRRFRRRAEQLNREAFDGIVALLLARKRDVRHADPGDAVRFCLIAVGSTLRTLVLSSEHPHPFTQGERLARELSHLCLQYLGVGGDQA